MELAELKVGQVGPGGARETRPAPIAPQGLKSDAKVRRHLRWQAGSLLAVIMPRSVRTP